MARRAREKSASGMYYVMLKAAYRLFLDKNDEEYFKTLLSRYVTFLNQAEIINTYISSQNVQMIIKENTKPISDVIKPLCTSYARYFNRKYSVKGRVFSDRFKSLPIETDEDLEKIQKQIFN